MTSLSDRPDALALLGEVDEFEIRCERASDHPGALWREVGEFVSEGVSGVGIAAAVVDGLGSDRLDHLERLGRSLGLQYVTQKCAEFLDILADISVV